jgi:GNAT superfamily N-acetyltransferase
MVVYQDSTDGVKPSHLIGFFGGWPGPPSAETHLRILRQSDHVLLARDDGTGQVAGFITAISDGVLCAYIPLLEVLPGWRGRGIGTELVRRMLRRLSGLYMIDLICEPALRPFCERRGMTPATGMVRRNAASQSGLS